MMGLDGATAGRTAGFAGARATAGRGGRVGSAVGLGGKAVAVASTVDIVGLATVGTSVGELVAAITIVGCTLTMGAATDAGTVADGSGVAATPATDRPLPRVRPKSPMASAIITAMAM